MNPFRLLALLLLLWMNVAQGEELRIKGVAYSGPADSQGGPIPDTADYDLSGAEDALSHVVGVPFTGCCGTTHARSRATADFGWLSAEVNGVVSGLNGEPYVGGLIATAVAEASYTDTLTFHQPSGLVGDGTATLVLDISATLLAADGGSSNELAPQGADTKFRVRFTQLDNGIEFKELLEKEGRVATHFLDPGGLIPPPDALGRFEIPIDFLFELPLEIKLEIYLYAYADGGLDVAELTSRALSTFSQVRWMGATDVKLFNGTGVPTDITSQSGTDYDGPLGEPPTFISGFEAQPD